MEKVMREDYFLTNLFMSKNENIKYYLQHYIKIMRKFIPKSKVSACLLASDFPSENPRTQTTHYSYT